MRIVTLLVLGLFTVLRAFAQEGITVCGAITENTEAFARLADNADFRNVHPNPLEYQHTDAAGEMISFTTPNGEEGSAYAIKVDENSTQYLSTADRRPISTPIAPRSA